jgi:hypothetical protein
MPRANSIRSCATLGGKGRGLQDGTERGLIERKADTRKWGLSMQIKIYTINVKLPGWLRRTLAIGVVSVVILGICAIVYAAAVTGQPDFVAGDHLSASSLNTHLGALQSQIDMANSKITAIQQTVLALPPSFGGSAMAVGSTDISVPGTLTSIPDMSVTLTTKGTSLLMLFDAPITSPDVAQVVIVFLVDGVYTRATVFSLPGTVSGQSMTADQTFHFLAKGLAPGSHTVTVGWYKNEGSPVQDGKSVQVRVLSVLDLP